MTDPPDTSPKLDPTSNSPEAMKIFQKAQKDILELNESRLKALEELESAKEKIAELESRLQRTADSGASSSSSTSSSSSQSLVGSITIIYETTWHKAFIHYTSNNTTTTDNTIPKAKDDDWGQWTELPGQHMSEIHIDRYVITVPATKMEFVMTDGQGGWDHPDGDTSRNYVLEEPGTYLLRESIVRKL